MKKPNEKPKNRHAAGLPSLLCGIPATGISAFFLLGSFLLPRLLSVSWKYLAWVCILISGLPIVCAAAERLIRGRGLGRISADLLISIAMAAAVCIGDVFAAGEVAVIMAIGNILEKATAGRAQSGIGRLLSLAPMTAKRITDEGEELIPASEIKLGDRLRVLPGESIPADGIILTGETAVDQSVLTGESLPVDKSAGDLLFCGTSNRFGTVDFTVTGTGEDTSLQKMIRLSQEAEEKKGPTARIVDRYAAYMVPSSMLIALVTFLITRDITRSVTVLLVFCPCALVLATPTAVMAAVGAACKYGIIIKSGEALEQMGRTDRICFDKTGTLTCGTLTVSDLLPFGENRPPASLLLPSSDKLTPEQAYLVYLTAAAEQMSEHPLGKAVVSRAKECGLTLPEAADFSMKVGEGVSAVIEGGRVLCGSERFLTKAGIAIPKEAASAAAELCACGKALIYTASNGVLVGITALSDLLRPDAKRMVRQLSDLSTEAVLLTGDHAPAAAYFAEAAGVSAFYSDLLPEEKVEQIASLQKEGHIVCMTGDGVNDAAALRTADVGIAMGAVGSDITAEAADIVLMSDDIGRLPYLRKLSNLTVKTIKISIAFSMTVNFAALFLSVLGLLSPTMGALVHNVGSVMAVLLAGMLYNRKID